MMKRIFQTLLYISVAGIAVQPLSHAAAGDWIKRKAGQAKTTLQKGARETKQAIQEKLRATRRFAAQRLYATQQSIAQLQETLHSYSDCIIQGTCKPGQKEHIKSLTKKVGITIGALLVAAAVVGVGAAYQAGLFDPEDVPVEIVQGGVKQQVQLTEEFKKKYGFPPDVENSKYGPMFEAIKVNAPTDVLHEVVDDFTVSKISGGEEYANNIGNPKAKNDLTKIKNTFIRLVRNAETGLKGLVKKTYCTLNPTSRAVKTAITKVSDKIGVEFKEITKFLKQPKCEGEGGE